jgi:hypothetical protein
MNYTKLFEMILREDKSSLIKKSSLPDPIKPMLIDFFKKHKEAEKQVDWNKLNSYDMKFFQDLFNEYENKG